MYLMHLGKKLISFSFLIVYMFCGLVGQTSLSFSGNSYIKYRVTESGQSEEMRLGLRIRTLQRRGVIMFTRVNPCTMLKVSTLSCPKGCAVSQHHHHH